MAADEQGRLTEMLFGAHLGHAVAVIAEIGVADLIGEGRLRPVSELASEMSCHPRALYRVMRFLASHGVFVEHGDGEFGHTALSRALRSDVSDSMRPLAIMVHRLFRGLPEFDHSLRTETSALAKALGAPIFQYLAEHPDEAAIFDAGMPSMHGNETDPMLDAYDFSGIGVLADIGGGGGTLIAAALQRHPDMAGILFDLDHVIERARSNLQQAGVEHRCQLVAGSFFESVPEGADAYLMRHIIHDWSDEESVKILQNCHERVSDNGRVLIVEAIVPEGNDPSPAKEMDMAMLLYPGGMERTETEYQALLNSAGFELAGVTPTTSMVSVLEGRPAS